MNTRLRVCLTSLAAVGACLPAVIGMGAAPVAAAATCALVGHVIPPRTTGKIDALGVVARGDVWAVGGRDISYSAVGPHSSYSSRLYAAHWTGSAWQAELPPPQAPYADTGELLGVAALAPNDVWAVGNRFQSQGQYAESPVALHWDGTAWTWMPPPPLYSLNAVAGTGPADVWGVGTGIAHWNGSAWQAVPLALNDSAHLTGVVALSLTDAWAVGSQVGPGSRAESVLAHWDGTTWTRLEVPALGGSEITAITAAGSGNLWIGGEFGSAHWTGTQWRIRPLPGQVPVTALATQDGATVWATSRTGLFRWDGQTWQAVGGPAQTTYGAVAVEGVDDVWAGGSTGSGSGTATSSAFTYDHRFVHIFSSCAVPTARVGDPHADGVQYFAATGHRLQGPFRAYWAAHGGLAQFGYPLTEEYGETSATDGQTYTVQYFERNRFEYHPENVGTPYEVLLGLLGRSSTGPRRGEPPFLALPLPPGGGAAFFPETGHTLGSPFAAYWAGHGGLAVYGYPISEPFTEVSPTDGKPYLVQYFERNRLEYHPELPAAFRISLGLLGADLLKARAWIP